MNMTEEYGWFWLCTIPGLYEADRRRLLDVYQSPEGIYEAAGKKKETFSFLSPKKAQAVKKHRQSFFPEEEYHKYLERGIKFISCRHNEYPEILLQIGDYPSGLFYRGELPKQEETCVAVIGARMCSYYGRNTAEQLSGKLAENGIAVISGMAYGIDAKAQEACLQAGGKSYGVLGCGVDICYPSENRALYERLLQNGGVISEFCPGTQPLPAHFPMRNRIISGLSKLVVVVEARKKSGTLITADMALEQGRDVYAFPGRPTDALSAGCNRLIQQGAGMITDIDEFLEQNGFLIKNVQKQKKSHLVLATSENLVYSCLDSDSKSLQMLSDEIDLPVWQLMSILGSLQSKGLIAEVAKNYYARIR